MNLKETSDMRRIYQKPAMKVKRIDMEDTLLVDSYIGKGTGNEFDAKHIDFTDDEEDDGTLKPYNPWE